MYFGICEMKLDLLNFKKGNESAIPLGDDHVSFTSGLYIDFFKVSKVRLYLSTMMNEENNGGIESDNNSEYSDSVLHQSLLDD